MNNQIERRNFLGMLLKGTAAVFFVAAIPFKSFFKKKRFERVIKAEIHPLAVKRNRKGMNG